MAQNELRVPKETVRVHLRIRGGVRWEGEIFLSGCSPFHDGPQSLYELLDDPDPFFPVRLADGEVRLVGKREVIVVSLPHPAAERYGTPTDFPIWIPARLVLVDEGTLEGQLNTSTAQIKHPRVLDALNGSGHFVCLKDEHAVRVVNKDAIRWVVSATKSIGEEIAHEEVTHG